MQKPMQIARGLFTSNAAGLSGHHIQARHHLLVIIVIAGQQLKGLEDRALDAPGQVFVAEDPRVRLAQLAADFHVGHQGSDDRRIVFVAALDDFLEGAARGVVACQVHSLVLEPVQDRVPDDVDQVLALEGEVGIAPGGLAPAPVGYVQVGLDTIFVSNGRAELAHRIYRGHQRPRQVLQGGVVGGTPRGVFADHRRHRQDHRRWQEAIAPKGIVDQEAREPAIAVTQRVDVDKAKGQAAARSSGLCPQVRCSNARSPFIISSAISWCGAK